jgi:hypothetical protein
MGPHAYVQAGESSGGKDRPELLCHAASRKDLDVACAKGYLGIFEGRRKEGRKATKEGRQEGRKKDDEGRKEGK